VKTEKKWASV